MSDTDIAGAVDLLTIGFPDRSREYWHRGFEHLRARPVPGDFPRYGYVLSDGERLVGIILTIFAVTDAGDIRGNVSSWYVEPAYRGFSNLLLAAPLKLKNVTLVNISPALETIDMIKVQGFAPYVGGSFRAAAALAPLVPGARLRQITAVDGPGLLADHAAWGCLSFEVRMDGETYPFVFLPCRFLANRFASAQLIYCREIVDFVRFAGPLGRRLLRHGLFAVLIDANGPLVGVPGVYRAGRDRKFFRGATAPRLGDLSTTELVLFGP